VAGAATTSVVVSEAGSAFAFVGIDHPFHINCCN